MYIAVAEAAQDEKYNHVIKVYIFSIVYMVDIVSFLRRYGLDVKLLTIDMTANPRESKIQENSRKYPQTETNRNEASLDQLSNGKLQFSILLCKH